MIIVSKTKPHISYPSRDGMQAEVDDVFQEVVTDDVYNLTFQDNIGNVWVDAGSHVGIFGVAATMAGAEVSVVIDMDGELALEAARNISRFRSEAEINGELEEGMIPSALAFKISTARQLYDAAMLTRLAWTKKRKRCCLKMDIQGAEKRVFGRGGAKLLTQAYDFMVFEWHHKEDPVALLEASGWKIIRISAHTDVLLGIDTRIIWATSG